MARRESQRGRQSARAPGRQEYSSRSPDHPAVGGSEPTCREKGSSAVGAALPLVAVHADCLGTMAAGSAEYGRYLLPAGCPGRFPAMSGASTFASGIMAPTGNSAHAFAWSSVPLMARRFKSALM